MESVIHIELIGRLMGWMGHHDKRCRANISPPIKTPPYAVHNHPPQ